MGVDAYSSLIWRVEGLGVAGSYSSLSWRGWSGCFFKFELEEVGVCAYLRLGTY